MQEALQGMERKAYMRIQNVPSGQETIQEIQSVSIQGQNPPQPRAWKNETDSDNINLNNCGDNVNSE